MSKPRIGIFAGTFDPVHAGHIRFALQALEAAKLQRIYFLPERQPRHKRSPEHFGHRTAMLSRAIRPHRHLAILELPDRYFDVSRTFPKLQREFAGSELVLLLGSDAVAHLPDWPRVETLLPQCHLVIGLRKGYSLAAVRDALAALPVPPRSQCTVVTSPTEPISSTTIRQALRHNSSANGLLASVRSYATQNWLYASIANITE